MPNASYTRPLSMMYKTSKFIIEEFREILDVQKENSNLVDENCMSEGKLSDTKELIVLELVKLS